MIDREVEARFVDEAEGVALVEAARRKKAVDDMEKREQAAAVKAERELLCRWLGRVGFVIVVLGVLAMALTRCTPPPQIHQAAHATITAVCVPLYDGATTEAQLELAEDVCEPAEHAYRAYVAALVAQREAGEGNALAAAAVAEAGRQLVAAVAAVERARARR